MINCKNTGFFLGIFKTLSLFFLGFCLFSLFLYAAGTRQGFTDKTQLLLLRLSRGLGLVLGGCSVWTVFFCFFQKIPGPRFRRALKIGAYFALCVFGFAVNLLMSFIIAVAGGNA
ncbi:MAG: hypothetical protein LBL28_08945 [Treponema sp.]|jgi:hypothetical protein|nr:hypothetical protein [Treponema sp.]